MYQKTYGSSNDNQDEDDDSESVSVVDVSSGDEDYSDAIDNEGGKGGKNDDDDYKLDGLFYSDDEAFLFENLGDSEDETRTSFPKDTDRRYISGPQKPDVSFMTESEGAAVLRAYTKKRKAHTDKERLHRAKLVKSKTNTSKLFTGPSCDQLRTMKVVENNRLNENHTFKVKETFYLRIAEEANLRCIKMKVVRSDDMNLIVAGLDFYVNGTYIEKVGWKVHVAICREGDDILKIPPKDKIDPDDKVSARTPFRSKWFAPIIQGAVLENPGASYSVLKEMIRPYANDYAITDSLVQQSRDSVKVKLFGTPEVNVKHATGVATALRALGHFVELSFTTRRETLTKVSSIVLAEEMRRLKKLKQTMNSNERKRFLIGWKKKHLEFLHTNLGYADGPQFRFLDGILFAPSSAKVSFPHLQDIIQADGAHTSFGKYTLYSAYATTANGNMSPLGFGILFGNEDTDNWSKFWKFIKSIHPGVNAQCKTIMTDQDKGSIAAIAEIINNAGQFHCAYHRRQNILLKCGGGNGKTALSALWMYNLLSGCNSVGHLEVNKTKYYPVMHQTNLHYLTKIPDKMQYAAARCAMDPSICMYGKSASSGVESMNRANNLARQKAAVDILNAAILLIKLEGGRFAWYKQLAWTRDELLTERGMQLMEEAFTDVHARDYKMQTAEAENNYVATVRKIAANSKEFTVTLPKKETMGSKFGSCTCGKPAKDGIPCRHMVVVVKSASIDGLTRIGIMPYWWTTAQWRKQYPENTYCRTEISIEGVKATSKPEDDIVYCPAWTAANKKGRPKKNARMKSIMDHIEESAKKKRKRKVKMFCKHCQKFNHTTEQCYLLKKPIIQLETVDEGGGLADDGREGMA